MSKKMRDPNNKFRWITEEEYNNISNKIEVMEQPINEPEVFFNEKTETDFINQLGDSTEQDMLMNEPDLIIETATENKSFFGKITEAFAPETEIDDIKISTDNLNAKSKASAVMSVAVLSLLVDGVCWYLNPGNKEEDRYKPKKAAIEAMENAFFEVYKLHDGVMSPYALLALAIIGGYAPIIFLAYRDGRGTKVSEREKERLINTGSKATVAAGSYNKEKRGRGRPKKTTINTDQNV